MMMAVGAPIAINPLHLLALLLLNEYLLLCVYSMFIRQDSFYGELIGSKSAGTAKNSPSGTAKNSLAGKAREDIFCDSSDDAFDERHGTDAN